MKKPENSCLLVKENLTALSSFSPPGFVEVDSHSMEKLGEKPEIENWARIIGRCSSSLNQCHRKVIKTHVRTISM
jgi:hypothetical protein